MKSKVTVLSKEQFIEKGYAIALVEKEGLNRRDWLTYDVQVFNPDHCRISD